MWVEAWLSAPMMPPTYPMSHIHPNGKPQTSLTEVCESSTNTDRPVLPHLPNYREIEGLAGCHTATPTPCHSLPACCRPGTATAHTWTWAHVHTDIQASLGLTRHWLATFSFRVPCNPCRCSMTGVECTSGLHCLSVCRCVSAYGCWTEEVLGMCINGASSGGARL